MGVWRKRPWRQKPAGPGGSFTRPDLAIPCRVAPQQSPTLFDQARWIVADEEGLEKWHPVGLPVIDWFLRRTI